jgi:hypothetical protein
MRTKCRSIATFHRLIKKKEKRRNNLKNVTLATNKWLSCFTGDLPVVLHFALLSSVLRGCPVLCPPRLPCPVSSEAALSSVLRGCPVLCPPRLPCPLFCLSRLPCPPSLPCPLSLLCLLSSEFPVLCPPRLPCPLTSEAALSSVLRGCPVLLLGDVFQLVCTGSGSGSCLQ